MNYRLLLVLFCHFFCQFSFAQYNLDCELWITGYSATIELFPTEHYEVTVNTQISNPCFFGTNENYVCYVGWSYPVYFNFGDGSYLSDWTGSGQHHYYNFGEFTICADHCAGSDCITIELEEFHCNATFIIELDTSTNIYNIIPVYGNQNNAINLDFSWNISTFPYEYNQEFNYLGDSNNSSDSIQIILNSYYDNFTICLFIDGNEGCSEFECQTLSPNTESCNANFEYLLDSTNNETIFYSNFLPVDSSLNQSFKWDFGDGNISYDEMPTHIYSLLGSYDVCLEYILEDFCWDVSCQTLIFDNPHCISEFDYELLNTGEFLFISNLVDFVTVHDSVSIKWIINDIDANNNNDSLKLVLDPDSSYLVCLEVLLIKDSLNTYYCNDLNEPFCLEIIPEICDATFTYNQFNNFIQLTSNYQFNSFYSWTFGNGDSIITLNPGYTFYSPGSYEVCSWIVNNQYCSNSYCETINIDSIISHNYLINENTIKLYPNPGSGIFQIHSKLSNSINEISIEIYSINGILLYQENHLSSYTKIDCNLGSGLYKIFIYSENKLIGIENLVIVDQ